MLRTELKNSAAKFETFKNLLYERRIMSRYVTSQKVNTPLQTNTADSKGGERRREFLGQNETFSEGGRIDGPSSVRPRRQAREPFAKRPLRRIFQPSPNRLWKSVDLLAHHDGELLLVAVPLPDRAYRQETLFEIDRDGLKTPDAAACSQRARSLHYQIEQIQNESGVSKLFVHVQFLCDGPKLVADRVDVALVLHHVGCVLDGQMTHAVADVEHVVPVHAVVRHFVSNGFEGTPDVVTRHGRVFGHELAQQSRLGVSDGSYVAGDLDADVAARHFVQTNQIVHYGREYRVRTRGGVAEASQTLLVRLDCVRTRRFEVIHRWKGTRPSFQRLQHGYEGKRRRIRLELRQRVDCCSGRGKQTDHRVPALQKGSNRSVSVRRETNISYGRVL